MEPINLICIMCPKGCNMTATKTDKEIKVTGNSCPRGKIYATEELTCPSRIVTSIIQTKYGVIAVKTDKPIQKEKIQDCLKLIKSLTPKKVKVGDKILSNILDTDVNLVVTRTAIN